MRDFEVLFTSPDPDCSIIVEIWYQGDRVIRLRGTGKEDTTIEIIADRMSEVPLDIFLEALSKGCRALASRSSQFEADR